ncbi:MAG: hypothetical protein QOH73_543 [Gaiellaceae bacterium]|jgi:hypothetical protein|nr:hypothetical protein [Gaiellaceae bacterium]
MAAADKDCPALTQIIMGAKRPDLRQKFCQ